MNECFMCSKTKIVCVYIYPLDGQQGFAPRALSMVESYIKNPPGLDHETVVVCNGAPAADTSKALFNPLPNVRFIDHDNSGWDIGGFQLVARTVPADLMVFFGAHTYFRKPGWLKRMVEAYETYGDTLYGSTGNQGEPEANVSPHIRTTAFWCHPELLVKYPKTITQGGGGGERYEAEHGPTCLTNWVRSKGRVPWVVGWQGEKPIWECNLLLNTFHNGTQDNLLVGDRLTAPPYWTTP